jgi:hypothetical protein
MRSPARRYSKSGRAPLGLKARVSPSFFFRVPEKDAAHRVTLPTGGARHLIDRGAFGSTQQRDHRVLLRPVLRVGCRLRQQLDRRPQLIDQLLAVADLLPPLDPFGAASRCGRSICPSRRNSAAVGQGLETVMAQIAADTLGLPLGRVRSG